MIFIHFLKYYDNAPAQDARDFTSELASTINIVRPKEDFEHVGPDDRLKLEKQVFEAESGIQALIVELKSRGYKSLPRISQTRKPKCFPM